MNEDNKLSRYQVIAQLGKGSYTLVELALDLHTGVQVVVKSLFTEKYPGWDKKKLHTEISFQRGVQDRGVVTLIDSFQIGPTIFVVMEYMSGGDLYTLLWHKKKDLGDLGTRKLFLQICKAVYAVHRTGVIHRDIKPENILLDDEMNAKLADFGWSCHQEDQSSLCDGAGTLAYMSPECLSEQPQTTACDVWSLGILIYELYHGREAFTGNTANERLTSILQSTVIFDKCHPPEAANIFYICTRHNPNERPCLDELICHPFFHPLISTPFQSPLQGSRSVKSSREDPFKFRTERGMGYTPLLKSVYMTGGKRRPMPHLPSLKLKNYQLMDLGIKNSARIIELNKSGVSVTQKSSARITREQRPISMGRMKRGIRDHSKDNDVQNKTDGFSTHFFGSDQQQTFFDEKHQQTYLKLRKSSSFFQMPADTTPITESHLYSTNARRDVAYTDSDNGAKISVFDTSIQPRVVISEFILSSNLKSGDSLQKQSLSMSHKKPAYQPLLHFKYLEKMKEAGLLSNNIDLRSLKAQQVKVAGSIIRTEATHTIKNAISSLMVCPFVAQGSIVNSRFLTAIHSSKTEYQKKCPYSPIMQSCKNKIHSKELISSPTASTSRPIQGFSFCKDLALKYLPEKESPINTEIKKSPVVSPDHGELRKLQKFLDNRFEDRGGAQEDATKTSCSFRPSNAKTSSGGPSPRPTIPMERQRLVPGMQTGYLSGDTTQCTKLSLRPLGRDSASRTKKLQLKKTQGTI